MVRDEGTGTARACVALLRGMVLGALLAGCPRELEPPPAGGEPCAETSDCNPGAPRCGELRLCVGGRCEVGRSLRVPCR
jgi:hypothetical protein